MRSEINPVQMHIIDPMQLVFQPPQHVRGDAQAYTALLETYHRVLGRFTRQCAKAGMG